MFLLLARITEIRSLTEKGKSQFKVYGNIPMFSAILIKGNICDFLVASMDDTALTMNLNEFF